MIGTGTHTEPVGALAVRLLASVGGLAALERLDAHELAHHRGLGATKAARIAAALELARRVRDQPLLESRPRIIASRDVHLLLRGRLASADTEQFVALALDARNRVVREWTVAIGSTTSCPVLVADAFRAVVRVGVPHVVFAHNHPSGDATPSEDDDQLTARLVAAGMLLGVRVLDHVVVARSGHYSYADAGKLLEGDERASTLAEGGRCAYVAPPWPTRRRPPLERRRRVGC